MANWAEENEKERQRMSDNDPIAGFLAHLLIWGWIPLALIILWFSAR